MHYHSGFELIFRFKQLRGEVGFVSVARGMLRRRVYIHNDISHPGKRLRRQWLRKEMSHVVGGGDIRYRDAPVLDAFSDKIVTPLNMLCARVMFRIAR